MFNWKDTGVSHPPLNDLAHPDLKEGSPELEQLWHDILLELTDKRFVNRTHGNPRTAEAGCSGPICRKGRREFSRRRRGNSRPQTRFLLLDPIIDYFKVQASASLAEAEKEVLSRLSRLAPSS